MNMETKKLENFLATTYALMLKTQNYHWNVKGPQFSSLHNLFEEQYTELFSAVDDIAEQIRIQNRPAPGSLDEFNSLSMLTSSNDASTDVQMLEDLENSHLITANLAKQILEAAEGSNDLGTADLMTQRVVVHEKAAWLLRSSR